LAFSLGIQTLGKLAVSNSARRINTSSEAMTEKTLLEFFAPSIGNICTGPKLQMNNLEFELKPSLINMVQATTFSGQA
jgi:hypothetical protein